MNRNLLLVALVLFAALVAAGPAPAHDWLLWYEQPARKWTEALPVGNGRLGAMVFGDVKNERIQLNEDTVWAGHPENRDRVGAYKKLPEIRQMFFDGKHQQGQKAMQRQFMGPRWIRSYQTLGDMRLDIETSGPIRDYRRQLNLDTAVVQVTYRDGDVRMTREVFSSPVDQVLVVRIQSDKPGHVTLRVRLDRPESFTTVAVGSDQLLMTGLATQGDQHAGVKFAARLQALAQGGKVQSTGQYLRVTKADAVTLLLTAETNYPSRQGNPSSQCARQLAEAAAKSYEALRQDHIRQHQQLMRRVDIDLGRTDVASQTTDKRLRAVRSGGTDPQLVALYFQFGRYLLISCSRPGCMPANLQGLWNEHIKAPWNCDYHININVQMDYWPAEVCNLSECHEPFFDLVDNLRPRGRKTARDVYGCAGFTAHHTTDAWWWTSPIGNVGYGMWPMGAAWCSRHLWEHYLFTEDQQFLAQRAYPIMKEAAEFCLDYLCEDPKTGRLVSGPSTSPENRFRTPTGQTAHLSMGCAMDQQIIWDLLTNCLKAAKVLGRNDDFVERTRTARQKLARPQIGPDGRLMEWAQPLDEPEPGHRHVSHLFGLHPGYQISMARTPQLAEAARKSLEYRLAHGGGHTGWSRVWIINFFARLQDAEKAHENVVMLLRKSTLPNLFDTHPPFQIDGNLGGTAGIAEMLVQSHAGQIALLPAWPRQAWPTGHVRGLRVRGAAQIDIDWRDGRATRVRLTADRDHVYTIQPPAGQRITRIVSQGKPVTPKTNPDGSVIAEVRAGHAYELTLE